MSDRQVHCTYCGRPFAVDKWSVGGAAIAVGVAVAVVVILVGVAVGLVVRRSADQSAVGPRNAETIVSPQDATTADTRVPVPWELSLPNGRLSLRTTAFEAMGLAKSESGQWLPTHRFGKEDTAVVRLVVELTNDSDQSAVLQSLKVAPLGQVTLREDQSVQILALVDALHEPPDLGRMACSLTTYRENASFIGDNLLAGADKVVIAAHTSKSYHIWLTCRLLALKLATFQRLVVLYGGADSLAGLDVMDPAIVGSAHVFTAIAEVVADGRRGSLCSDRVYAVVPDSPPHTIRLIDDQLHPGAHVLRDSYSLPPEQFVRRIVGWSVKSHAETLAYEIAVKTKAVPAGFDPGAISPKCYSGDRDSPLRSDELQRFTIVRLRGPSARSNIVSVLLSIWKKHPALWSVMEEEITRLCSRGAEDRLARKAKYVKKELMRQAKREKMWP